MAGDLLGSLDEDDLRPELSGAHWSKALARGHTRFSPPSQCHPLLHPSLHLANIHQEPPLCLPSVGPYCH